MKRGALLAVLPLVFGSAALLDHSAAEVVADSTSIGTAQVESKGMPSQSDGDLWPSCWAGNDKLYAANGDGKGFSLDQDFADIAVNEITGSPGNLSGTTISKGDQVGSIWSGAGYNRKPTGMVCVGDTIYLAVQDLALDFNDVGYVHHELTVTVPPNIHELTVYAGFNAPNTDTWIQVDDFTVE